MTVNWSRKKFNFRLIGAVCDVRKTNIIHAHLVARLGPWSLGVPTNHQGRQNQISKINSGMSVFIRVHGEWIGRKHKRNAWIVKQFSGDLFVLRSDSFHMKPEKKTLIPDIYNASNKDPYKQIPRNITNSKFPM